MGRVGRLLSLGPSAPMPFSPEIFFKNQITKYENQMLHFLHSLIKLRAKLALNIPTSRYEACDKAIHDYSIVVFTISKVYKKRQTYQTRN